MSAFDTPTAFLVYAVFRKTSEYLICYHRITSLQFSSHLPCRPQSLGGMLISVKATTLWISFSIPALPTTSETAVTHSNPLQRLFVEKRRC